MTLGEVRRSQLVTPFGTGAMSVLVNGTSVITAGLDHWFPEGDANVDAEEFTVHDRRLEQRLQVSGFRLPPDHRTAGGRNEKLAIPVLRFPLWHFCPYCKRLKYESLTRVGLVGCPDPKHGSDKTTPRMAQVPFVVICRNGHIDDFPFAEWVHRSASPACRGPLRLSAKGSNGLEGQVVTCDACGKSRSLQGTTQGRGQTTVLSATLDGAGPFGCRGFVPWLGNHEHGCGQPVRLALRGSGNVYFPKVESSIYLPRQGTQLSPQARQLLASGEVSGALKVFKAQNKGQVSGAQLRAFLHDAAVSPDRLAMLSDAELAAAFEDRFGTGDDDADRAITDLGNLAGWRYPEYQAIRDTPNEPLLRAVDPGLGSGMAQWLSRIRCVEVLQETRALRGFTRVQDGNLDLLSGKALLRRRRLPREDDWLPAYVVRGEGLYLELDQERLAAWEERPDVQHRAGLLASRHEDAVAARGIEAIDITPRLILLHTLAHILVNQLVFACGYSSASLRERLYASAEPGQEMAGLVLYTAAGDSEGTMGGLVRMGTPDRFGPIMTRALARAGWCSSDPVCMQLGEKGQGPNSCNLAACHSCALLPETSCEHFNQFLDRGLLVGTFEHPDLGFFSSTEGAP